MWTWKNGVLYEKSWSTRNYFISKVKSYDCRVDEKKFQNFVVIRKLCIKEKNVNQVGMAEKLCPASRSPIRISHH